MTASIEVRVRKYRGPEYRRWPATVSRREGSLIVLDAEFEEVVEHNFLGSIPKGTRTHEYYWLDRWYNVFRFLKPDGQTRLWYCNVSTPATFADGVLSYEDLDIDVLVQQDLSYVVLDLDEFETNAERLNYSAEAVHRAHQATGELKEMIKTRQFPFVKS